MFEKIILGLGMLMVTALNNAGVVGDTWWKPEPDISWYWQLEDTLNLNYDVEVYDVDLFDTSKADIEKLQAKGIKVICYFSAGTYESWREDSDQYDEALIGKPLEDWPDEKWLDISKINSLSPIILERLSLAVEKGCDGVEPDNVDGFENDSGFNLTAYDQLKFNKWLANEAHKLGLAVGLKNDLSQVDELVAYFDFAVNEQCFEYDECDILKKFIEKNKAVFGVEYNLEKSEFCDAANAMNFSWLKMDLELNGSREAC